MSTFWNDRLQIFDTVVDKCPRFKRKGKSMIYTSANGYMFALLNKEGQIGFRFDSDTQQKHSEAFGSGPYLSHGAVMKGYVLIPDSMLSDPDTLAAYLNESYDYVMSLPKK